MTTIDRQLFDGAIRPKNLDWLYKISITCFAASYAVVLALEVSRIFFAARLRPYVRVGFAAAGLFAHSVYLLWQGKLELDSSGIWLNSWFGWCLAAAWILAGAYLWIALRHSKSIFGVFLLPVTLLLIWGGFLFGSDNQFATGRAKSIWGMVHGISLSLGTAVIALGFVCGIVYLIHAKRLKKKLPPPKLFRLPSLEWLQKSSERSLIVSTILLALGLLSGIALNLAKNPTSGLGSDVVQLSSKIAWSDPVIWSSGILFAWLVLVTTFNKFYQPARQGRKVAYLVVTSFLFLVLELGIVLWSGHAVAPANETMNVSSSTIGTETNSNAGQEVQQ